MPPTDGRKVWTVEVVECGYCGIRYAFLRYNECRTPLVASLGGWRLPSAKYCLYGRREVWCKRGGRMRARWRLQVVGGMLRSRRER